MIKKYIDLQKKILDESRKALSSRNFDRTAFLIYDDADDKKIYVCEKGYVLHAIPKMYWFLNSAAIGNLFLDRGDLRKAIKEIPETKGHFTGMTRENKAYKRTLVEIECDETGEKIYIDKKYMKYVPDEYCTIRCSSPKKPVFFILNNGEMASMNMPVVVTKGQEEDR